MELQRGVPEQK